MSFKQKDIEIYREDEKSGHRKLGAEAREELVKVCLCPFFFLFSFRRFTSVQLISSTPSFQLEANIDC